MTRDMAYKVLLMIPTQRNGGIQTWARNYLKTFKQDRFVFTHIETAPKRSKNSGLYNRIMTGLSSMFRQLSELKTLCKHNRYDILHRTTSGSLGALADWVIGVYCHHHHMRNILHCHYGKIVETLQGKGLITWLTKKSMQQYDQIWVLDKTTQQYLVNSKDFKANIFLTPNFIDVDTNIQISPKQYINVAFIANLYVEKGILDLIDAIKQTDSHIKLHIIGDGDEYVKRQIREHAGELYGERIKSYGMLPHGKAMTFMSQADILALPTYYPAEAFPISILEAMSMGKLVISTSKGAIPDMLTDENGKKCGIIIPSKNPQKLAEAIQWAYDNNDKADELCALAYKRVYEYYRTEKVYDIYRNYYLRIMKK